MFLLVGGLLKRVDGRVLIAISISSLAVAGALLALELVNFELGWTMWSLKNRVASPQQLELHQPDPVLGWVNKPNASVTDRHYDYVATYNTDSHRFRETESQQPGNENIPTILCLGGSFTFGQGVENDQTYPAYWDQAAPDVRVLNAGVNGWGTVQALLFLQRILESDSKPSLVTYGLIPSHADRNADRETWLDLIDRSGRKKPVLINVEGQLVFDRLIGAGEGRPASELLGRDELQLTINAVSQMSKLCNSQDIEFYCLLLGDDRSNETAEQVQSDGLVRLIANSGVRVIDFLDLPKLRYPHDGHPTREWHQRVGERLVSKAGVQALAARAHLHDE
jgi:hypothetical protein